MNLFRSFAQFVRRSPLEFSAAFMTGVAALVGGYTLVVTHASGPFAYSDASQATLSGNAKLVADATATNGKALQFGSATTPPATGSRDPLKQPFSSDSIWNMPIGTGAQYVAANLSDDPAGDVWAPMPQVDDEHIILKPTAPLTDLKYSSAGWGGNRCNADGNVLARVPIPSGYTVPSSGTNSGASFLGQDGRTIVQSQPFARCTAGGIATSLLTFPNVDLYSQGITGAHGGSGLSSVGGSLRIGELRPGQQGPKHALKVNVYAKSELYHCSSSATCSRWPATKSDSYAVGWYGSANNNANTAMKMGTLLAIPTSTDINSLGLQTEPAKQLAWTLQNYGAYIVDDTYGAGFAISAEDGPDGSMRTQFKNDYGFDLEQRVRDNTSWSRDMQRLVKALSAVNNNGPNSIGGGGTPKQPLAPVIAP